MGTSDLLAAPEAGSLFELDVAATGRHEHRFG
jgi:hypothetical protein